MTLSKAEKVLSTPAYPFVEAAHYLNLPLSTLRAWCLGQPMRPTPSSRQFKPLIRMDDRDLRSTLSPADCAAFGRWRRCNSRRMA